MEHHQGQWMKYIYQKLQPNCQSLNPSLMERVLDRNNLIRALK
ncbi:hypothetical protein [Microbulbifer epialgicus]|uniref:Uncharacterized protein n=1 Tax=Microbulbifer epialgicus TaxID=393907 RepID=A0ABV4P5L2_9GAMM